MSQTPIKLILSWDIVPQHEQEYFEFVIREFLPGIQKLGFALTDAWATTYGDEPQIMVGAVFPTLHEARQLLISEEWIRLNNKILNFVENYRQKIIPARSGFQF